MKEKLTKKIWKIRTVKNYPEAHNHLLIGEVLELGESYVRLNCRTYHFGPKVNGIEDIVIGEVNVRVLPWSRIEIVNELSEAFDYAGAALCAEENDRVVLKDKKWKCTIVYFGDSRY